MLRRALVFIVALTVGIAGVLTTVPPTAQAAPAASIRVVPVKPMAGERVAVRVRVPGPGVRPVRLQRRRASGWATVRRAPTTKRGVVDFTFRAPRGPVRLRAAAPRHRIGDRWLPRRVARPIRLRPVRQSVTFTATRNATDRIDVRAVVSHPRKGRRLRLQRREAGGAWRTVASARTGTARVVRLDDITTVEEVRGHRLRVVLARHRGAAAARSQVQVPPQVTLESPVVDGDQVHATATTSGTVTKVRFFVNGALMAEDSTAPYVARWPARVGTRDVVARAVGPLESAVSEALDYSVESAPVGAESGLADGFALETVQNGLVLPTSAAPLPSGAVLVTEKAGRVQVLEPLTGGGYAPPRLVLDLSEEVEDSVDAGLIGIAASPRIATDGHVFLSYVRRNADSGPERTQQIVRFDWDGQQLDPTSRHVVLGSATGPECSTIGDVRTPDCVPLVGSAHTIGDLVFDARGRLLVGVGDGAMYFTGGGLASRHEMWRAQDPDVLAGKVLRIDPRTGRGVPDNPLYSGDGSDNASRVVALGLRNPFRLAIDAGRLVIGDVGETAFEEINVVRLDELDDTVPNFGWPCLENDTETALGDVTDEASSWHGCAAVRRPGAATPPVHAYPHDADGGSVSGGVFLRGAAYPDRWRGQYVFGDYAQNFIRAAEMTPAGDVTAVSTLADRTAAGGPVKFFTGPDGLMWAVSIMTGAVRRLRWTGEEAVGRCPVGAFRRTFHDLDGPSSEFDREFADDEWRWLYPYAAVQLPAERLGDPTCEDGIELDTTGSPWVGAGTDDRAHPGDRFGASWRGRIDVEAGTYRFMVRGSEWIRLWVDDLPVHDFYSNDFWADQREHEIVLTRGQHVVRAELVHGDVPRAHAHVTWERVGGPPEVRLLAPENGTVTADGRIDWAVEVSDPDDDEDPEQLAANVEVAADYLHYTGRDYHSHPSSRIRGRLTGSFQVDDAHSPGHGVIRLRATATDSSGARAVSAPVYVCFPGGAVGVCSD